MRSIANTRYSTGLDDCQLVADSLVDGHYDYSDVVSVLYHTAIPRLKSDRFYVSCIIVFAYLLCHLLGWVCLLQR